MYDELVKRLKSEADFPYNDNRNLLREAADVIEKLQQENDFLKGMQKQLVRNVPLEDLGQMVYGELRRGGHV